MRSELPMVQKRVALEAIASKEQVVRCEVNVGMVACGSYPQRRTDCL